MKTIEQKSFFWNTAAGLVNAGQSFVYLLIIRWCCGLDYAGLFSFAFANANLFLCLGKYGMRKYQVTDINEEFRFSEYFISRILTTIIMLLGVALYAILYDSSDKESANKIIFIVVMGILKSVDSFDDVLLGMFQQKKRLDIGAKNSCLRNTITIIAIFIVLLVTKKMILAFVIGEVISIILLIVFFRKGLRNAEIKIEQVKVEHSRVLKLLLANLPLAIGDFLSFYIINSPKYAIDYNLSEEIQAYYGIISMPILIIALFSDFAFNPMLVYFSESWHNDKSKFMKLMLRQFGVIIICTVVVIILGGLIGLPILEMMYNVDLGIYQFEFVVLLVGGGFAATYSFLYALITAIREQKFIIPIYGVVAIVIFAVSNMLVVKFNMMGAAILYLASSVGLTILFMMVIVNSLKNNRQRGNENV